MCATDYAPNSPNSRSYDRTDNQAERNASHDSAKVNRGVGTADAFANEKSQTNQRSRNCSCNRTWDYPGRCHADLQQSLIRFAPRE